MNESRTQALATLTFNTPASREMFAEERAKGLRVRIDRGVVSLRAVIPARGEDVVAIERRPRGVVAQVPTEQRRFLQRLFKFGLTQELPYFALEPTTRGWFGIEHYPFDHPPQRQAILAVSAFESPLVAMDWPLWRRFQRLLTMHRQIDETLWQSVYKMIVSAVTLTARPIRGRPSQERLTAQKLLSAVARNAQQLVGLGDRQPEFASTVAEIVAKVTDEEQSPLAPVISIREPEPVEDRLPEEPSDASPPDAVATLPASVTTVNREYVKYVLATTPVTPDEQMLRTWDTVRDEPESEPELAVTEPERAVAASEPVAEPVPARVPVRRRRRQWPKLAPVELPADDREPAQFAVADEPEAERSTDEGIDPAPSQQPN